jgi:hypothetical protein
MYTSSDSRYDLDIEVFWADDVVWQPDGTPLDEGYFWWPRLAGGYPATGPAVGPFATIAEAIADMRHNYYDPTTDYWDDATADYCDDDETSERDGQ